ncbi:MAG TPA: 30S ribosomal protein S4 [Pontiellaceae bacterium]|nr:30S ribosomal protein S4 [Pontiellaceae bacterium]
MKYNGPKIKKARRLGIALSPKCEKFLERRPHPPGQHGPSKRRNKLTDYGKQLIEKQRLQYQYNLTERQLRGYYAKAARKVGNTADIMLQLLETRFDAVVLRSGFARSIYQARQLVGHAHFLINGKKVNIPSYQMRIGDVITVREGSRELEIFPSAQQIASTPAYLTVDDKKLTASLSRLPEHGEVPVQCEASLVVEFYSR